jgi:Zn-dependent M28 family amino/carboxypeptidase
MTVRIRTVSKLNDLHSPNVVAMLKGSDSSLAAQYVAFTAHLDHLGIGEPVKGDKIYNGALDNASGSAILLEVARAYARMNPRPKRSLLFVAVTGEERGLLGSDYFAHYPTVEKNSIVADVNMDEDLMLWPLKDIVAFGAEHSSLENVVKEAASRLDLSSSPDPMPQEVIFIRSDQYSFVKQGIPSVFPVPGFHSDDPNVNPEAIFKNWEETRYHQPQDDMNQPGLDFDAAAKYTRFIFLCGWTIAEQADRPHWNTGDFFGERYAKNAK